MPAGYDSYGVRDYPPPCRHTKSLTEKDLKIKNLETEVKKLQEHKKHAEAEADALGFDKEEQSIELERCRRIIDAQRLTIYELEQVLKTQQAMVDNIFGSDPAGAESHASQLGATAKRMQEALRKEGRHVGPELPPVEERQQEIEKAASKPRLPRLRAPVPCTKRDPVVGDAVQSARGRVEVCNDSDGNVDAWTLKVGEVATVVALDGFGGNFFRLSNPSGTLSEMESFNLFCYPAVEEDDDENEEGEEYEEVGKHIAVRKLSRPVITGAF